MESVSSAMHREGIFDTHRVGLILQNFLRGVSKDFLELRVKSARNFQRTSIYIDGQLSRERDLGSPGRVFLT